MKQKNIIFTMLVFSISLFAQNSQQMQMQMNHSNNMQPTQSTLSEAGQDAFGTIQEVIRRLNSNPNTDWKKVNLEVLRQHLIDMNDMTLHVDVISKKPIKYGALIVIKPNTKRSKSALKRILKAHPKQLKMQTGWDMKVTQDGDTYILKTTSNNKKDVDKIRGLGYIGLMAFGMHHQVHHWMMATGKNPHH